MNLENTVADDGFYFGLGVFETISVLNGVPALEAYHLERLASGLETLGISLPCENQQILQQRMRMVMREFEEQNQEERDRYVLKVCVTPQNLKITARRNTYTERDYEKGFHLRISPILRNETSPFTSIKSLNYGDNILEKRRAHREGFDEPVFLNRKGFLTEGATTNLFGVLDGELITPHASCGLLPGTVRRYVLEHFFVREVEMTPQMLFDCTEVFVTNALLGIMPVSRFEEKCYHVGEKIQETALKYKVDCCKI
ncbi:MAG: aminotransferase class IV [Lachnospiraceae bacterium]|nr:aminotransferase class IV [Lachnospiraceae bacterium]